MIQTLLERMDNLLDDESPVANHQEVAPLVDDALLRLKVWSHELHKRNPQALDVIRAEDLELHTMIFGLLQSINETLECLERVCKGEKDNAGTFIIKTCLKDLETSVSLLADLSEPIITCLEIGLKTGIMFQVKKVMESKGKATTEPKHLSLRSDETEEETTEQLLDTMKRAWVPLAHSSGAEPRPGFWLFRKDTREELKAAFMNMLAFSLFVLKYIIFWVKRASKNALQKLNNLNPRLTRNSSQRVNQNHQPKSPEDFLINIEKSFQGTATERLLKGNPDFARKVAEKAAALDDSEEPSIWKGELLAKTAQVTLHQQVLYCDDSSSIGRKNRWTVQNELIYRIARVTTRLLPEGEGIYLRYINQDVPESGSLRFDEIPNITRTLRPAGGTPIGTNLRSKVLNPFVYKRLPYDLKRPLLITVITNGAPSIEQKSAFVEAIKECGDKLEENNLPRESVKFLVGRVGTAKAAKAFLDELRRDSQIAKVLFVATERLDSGFMQWETNAGLDRWLIDTLYQPIMQSEGKKNQ